MSRYVFSIILQGGHLYSNRESQSSSGEPQAGSQTQYRDSSIAVQDARLHLEKLDRSFVKPEATRVIFLQRSRWLQAIHRLPAGV